MTVDLHLKVSTMVIHVLVLCCAGAWLMFVSSYTAALDRAIVLSWTTPCLSELTSSDATMNEQGLGCNQL